MTTFAFSPLYSSSSSLAFSKIEPILSVYQACLRTSSTAGCSSKVAGLWWPLIRLSMSVLAGTTTKIRSRRESYSRRCQQKKTASCSTSIKHPLIPKYAIYRLPLALRHSSPPHHDDTGTVGMSILTTPPPYPLADLAQRAGLVADMSQPSAASSRPVVKQN